MASIGRVTRLPARAAAVVIVTAGLLAATLAPASAGSPDRVSRPGGVPLPGTNCPVFPPDNYWNTRIDNLPVHPMSAAWLSRMHSSLRLHPDFGPSFGAQSVPYGIPITIVNGGPRVPVTFEYASESDRVKYPLSAVTLIEGGADSDGDRHAIVVDASTCQLFETWNTRRTSSGWTAGSGATWDLTSNALRRRGWTSADAAGLPILPGLLRWDEVKALEVSHAIRFTTNVTQRAFTWPARHQAGSTNDPSFPPMGARFRLAPDYPTDGLSPEARAIVTAMQVYGLVLADNGSPWYFQGAADSDWPTSLLDELKAIPARAFEAVDTRGLRVTGSSGAART
jgi:hypothetical protein